MAKIICAVYILYMTCLIWLDVMVDEGAFAWHTWAAAIFMGSILIIPALLGYMAGKNDDMK